MRNYKNNLQRNPKESFLIYELVLSYIGSGYKRGVINYNYGCLFIKDTVAYNTFNR